MGYETDWSLNELYESFQSQEFTNDMERFISGVKNLHVWCDNNLAEQSNEIEKIERYINMVTDISNLESRLYDFSELTLSIDANNEEALSSVERIQEIDALLSNPQTKFSLFVKNCADLDSIINSSQVLKEYAFYLKEIHLFASHMLSEKEEELLSRLKNTGSNAWVKLQNNVVATVLVDINIDGEDKRLPMPVIRNMAYDENAEIRKKAYDAEINACKNIAKYSAYALNGIKGEVLSVCEMRGYKSPLEMTLLQSRMEPVVLDVMISSIYDYIWMFEKYFKRKAKILKHDENLPFYDLFAPVGKADFKFTYDEAVDFIVEKFSKFSKNLGEYARTAAEKKWVDVMPKAGKRGGAFCQNLHFIKESRIMLNFTGSFNDVLTLAHELGHGYHGAMLANEKFLNSDYPMPIAETASTFCETIVINKSLQNCTDDEAIEIIENDISSNAQVIVDILSRYLFETKVFKLRKDGSISEKKLCDLMIEAQKEAYGDSLDENYLHPYMWVIKPHYYDADYNFYNFPYAFGQLFSKGLYAKFEKEGEKFVAVFDKMLSVTGKLNLVDVAKVAEVDITKKEFWDSSLDIIKNDIERYLELTE